MRRSDNASPVIVVAMMLAMTLAYLGGYIVFSIGSGYPDRVFPNYWIFQIYRPMLWAERMITKRDIEAGWGPRIPAD